ncbi:palmd [Pungitius sinensis]
MEESDLLKERLQAITEKHRIQDDIRQRKLELDREKVKLQHLKKKALRERWLLQDSASHNAKDSPHQQSLLSDQQQTRALQLNIHRIEMEVQSLEREESRISTNESFILNRLKAVERSSGDIIKEAQDSFVPDPLLVSKVSPDVPESLSPPGSKHSETNTPRRTLFAMEINVTRNLLTGQSTVLSTASVHPEKGNQHAGLKVYDDGTKCVDALNSQGSHDQSCVSVLSANEVEQLLRSATVHRHHNHSQREKTCCFKHQDERDGGEGFDLRNQRGCYGSHLLRNTPPEKEFNGRQNGKSEPGGEYHYGRQESVHRQQEERMNQSNLREGHRLGNHSRVGHPFGNQRERHCSPYQVRNCHCVQEDRPSHHTSSIINSVVNRGRANDRPPPRSHDQGTEFDCPGQLCYTSANYIPVSDYINVGEEELYGHSPPSHHSHDGRTTTALCSGPAPSDRAPSPIYGDNIPYTILNAMETTEPITAIFMGFQTAQDDSFRGREFEGSLKAELVVIQDNADCSDDHGVKKKKCHIQLGQNGYPIGGSSNGGVGSGVRKMPNRQRPCCTVC